MFKIRTIEKGVSDLPENFAVVEADSYESGLAAIATELAKPGINLVVWDNAGDLLPEKLKEELPQFLQKTSFDIRNNNLSYSSDPDDKDTWLARFPTEKYLSLFFNELAQKHRAGESLLKDWQEQRLKLCEAFDKQWNLALMHYFLECKNSLKLPQKQYTAGVPHSDAIFSRQIRLTTSGLLPATLFANEKDRGKHIKEIHWDFKTEADTLWMPRQWAIAAFGAGKKPSVLHVNPNQNYYPHPPGQRALEIFDLIGKKPFIG